MPSAASRRRPAWSNGCKANSTATRRHPGRCRAVRAGTLSRQAALRCGGAAGAERPARESQLGAAVDGIVELPGWGGRLRLVEALHGGLAPASLADARLRPRGGGEQFQIEPGRPPRSLKKQFQAAGVPARLREGPLVYVDGELAYVPGLGHDSRTWAPEGTPQVVLCWEGLARPPAGR